MSRTPIASGFPCCVRFPCAYMPSPLPRRKRWVLSFIFPNIIGLPRYTVGSASALAFSRPAQRSLTLRPVCSPSRLKATLYTEVLQRLCYLYRRFDCYRLERPVAGRESHSLKTCAFHGTPCKSATPWLHNNPPISGGQESFYFFLFLPFCADCLNLKLSPFISKMWQ